MKSIREWLEKLPEPVKAAAFENLRNHYISLGSTPDYQLNSPCHSFRSALFSSFIFEATPQGARYWFEVFDRYENTFSNGN